MNDKRANLRERSRRFRRRLGGKDRGVSPVVATLILILIAVAAAAALYLWLVAWQGNITKGIGQPGAQYTVTVGGSTSVYPFSQLAANWFQQNNSDINISDNQGGTGAGMLAVCEGHIDVGAASSPQTAAGLIASDNCPTSAAITITTIAYDAVDVIVSASNTHGLQSIYYDTLTYIYDRASTTTPTLQATTLNGVTISSITGYPTTGTLEWANIPAMVNGASFSITGNAHSPFTQQIGVYAVAGGSPCGAPLANDICDTGVLGGGAATGTPCGFWICASGAQAIVPVERSDASGTTQTFEARLLDASSASGFTTFASLGYSGCGSNNLLTDCGISLPSSQQANGNPGVVNLVGGNANAIGYASDGIARSTASVGSAGIIAYQANGQTVNSGSGSAYGFLYGAVTPTTGAGGTISNGVKGVSSSTSNQYAGWRPFEFVTLNPPTGEVERFFEFLLDPANNINLATAANEVSIYSV